MSILWEPHALAGPPTLAEQNWKALGALSNADRSSLLYFLFGYFERNEKFQEQIAWWLKEFEKT